MRENEKAECFNQAIALLVEAAVDRVQPREPGAYASKVRADLNERLRPVARELFAKHDDLTGDELAILLEAHERPQQPPEPPSPTAAIGEWHGPVRRDEDGPVLSRADAARRVAAIKEALAHVHKPKEAS